jgi:hypothetical protein
LLEIGASRDNLVYKIFDAEDVMFAERLLDDTIVGQRNTLLIDFAISTLVDQLTNRLQIRLAGKVKTLGRNNQTSGGKQTRM